MSIEYVEIEDAECVWATDDAIKVRVNGKAVWLPKKCISRDSDVSDLGHVGTLIVSESIAVEKGLA